MYAAQLIHNFTESLLKRARQHGIGDQVLPPRRRSGVGYWTGEDFVAVLKRVAHTLEDAFYGFAASPCPLDVLALGYEVMVLSENLGTALERSCRLFAVATDGMTFRLTEQAGIASLEIIPKDPALDEDHFLVEWNAVRWHSMAEWLIGEEILLDRVEFAHQRQNPLLEYHRVFGDNSFFMRPVNRISFPSKYLHRRVIRQIKDLESVRSSKSVAAAHIQKSWSNLLKGALRARLSRRAAIPTMEELAIEFGVCSQTLRRKLRAENSSYRKVKAAVRHEVVLENIANDELTLSEVSLLAGFAETNGLVRAMKSWTGLSPSQYRNMVGANLADEKYLTSGKTVN